MNTIVLSVAQAGRYSKFMIVYYKYHNISYSVQNMVLRNVTVHGFYIFSAVRFPKTLCGIECDILCYLNV